MPRRVHFVLSTHWDREWHHTFQDFRYRLVQMIDRVLAGWQDGRLQGPFQMDGQAILLDDYLEIRPEQRAEIEHRVRSGHLVVGPWYVLPDEFLVSGESLLRNLRLGRETARAFGGTPSKAGFLCDMFGHNSQMPQLFAGFGISGAFVWRGTKLYDQRHFIWRGADGTTLPTYRFPWNGYCTYATVVRRAHSPIPLEAEQIAERLEEHLQTEAAATAVGPILAFDGGDHLEWDAAAYAVLAQRFGQANAQFEIVHTSLDAYLDELLPESGLILPLLNGELREPALEGGQIDQQWLIPGVTSSRVWIKQANAACESLLCQWAEPFGALAQRAVAHASLPGYLHTAWKWLISNHPHDSMCGCSIDAVHEDMRYRFAQTRQIAERLTIESTRSLAASVAAPLAENELRVTVFNPLPRPFAGVADLKLDTPIEWMGFGEEMGRFESRPGFCVLGPDGAEMPYQRLGQTPDRTRTRMYDTTFPRSYRVNQVDVALWLEIPALGYTTLTLRPDALPTRQPAAPGLATSECCLENEFLVAMVESNGSLTLTDKRSGETYTRLLTFEDRADIGDGWNFGAASQDQAFSSAAARAAVAVLYNGPQLATLRVRATLALPAEFDFGRMRRSENMTDLVVDSLITLRAGSDHLEVETTVHNSVRDHRLRVIFPSGAIHASHYLADTPFDVVERPIALRADNYRYREPEVETKPQQTWFGVFHGARGLAVISSGLLEGAVIDQLDRPLALTLFRATRRTVNTDGEPLGQLQSDLTFRYWLQPQVAAPDRVQLCELGQQLAGGLRSVQLTPPDCAQHRGAAPLPASAGFITLKGQVVLTSLRAVAGGLEARLFNPTPDSQRASLDVRGWAGATPAPTLATPVNFESHPSAAAEPFTDGQIHFALRPKEILTLRLE